MKLRPSNHSPFRALLEEMHPLIYRDEERRSDLPAHVRAGSAVSRWGERLIVVQDDVHALAMLDEATGTVTPILLPPGKDGRRTFGEATGNKALKMDLEASFVLPDGRLVALGSGSTEKREHVVILDGQRGPGVVEGRLWYEHLRRTPEFAGSELNLEGAAVVGNRLYLFQRGNGAPRNGLHPVNAVGELELDRFIDWLAGGPVPKLTNVRQADLGTICGVPLSFTDAAALPDGKLAFLAVAEDSPDAYQDGAVGGCCFGLLDGDRLELTPILEASGKPTAMKLEGIDPLSSPTDEAMEFVVVADMDAPDEPAAMGRLRVGPSEILIREFENSRS